MSSNRNLLGVTVALAFLAGLLRGSRMLLPVYLTRSGGLPIEGVGAVLSWLSILLLVADPLALLALGYLWGRRADVADAYLGFGGRLFAAALVGFAVGYAAIFLSLPELEGSIVVRTAMVSGVAGVKTAANLALAALAASALAHFRGRYRPGPSRSDDSPVASERS
jgi:MFS family permease